MEYTGLGPPRKPSSRSMVSSTRNRVEFSINDKVGAGKIARPLIATVTKSASPPLGRPRTKILAPDTPPELSTHTPGMVFNKSAVLAGDTCLISASSTVEIAKLASKRFTLAPPGVPVTINSSIVSPPSCAITGACTKPSATAPRARFRQDLRWWLTLIMARVSRLIFMGSPLSWASYCWIAIVLCWLCCLLPQELHPCKAPVQIILEPKKTNCKRLQKEK